MARKAFLLANESFTDPRISGLASPVSDVERLRELLERDAVGPYEVEVCCEEVSAVVRLRLQKFFASANCDDMLFVLISGHGFKDRGGRFHFATKDTDIDVLSATAVGSRFILERMDESDADQQVLFIDACYSGAFQRGSAPKGFVTKDDFSEAGTGKAVITASTAIQVAAESVGEGLAQSYFTQHLIEGIESGGADRENRGDIHLSHLFSYIRDGLKRSSPGQTPQPFYFGLSPSVVVARNPCWIAARLPEELEQRIADPRRTIRGSAIEDLFDLARNGGQCGELAKAALLKINADDDSLFVSRLAGDALAMLSAKKPENSDADAGEDANEWRDEEELPSFLTALRRNYQKYRESYPYLLLAIGVLLITVVGIENRHAISVFLNALFQPVVNPTPTPVLPISAPTPTTPCANYQALATVRQHKPNPVIGKYKVFFDRMQANLTPKAESIIAAFYDEYRLGNPTIVELVALVENDSVETLQLAAKRLCAVRASLERRGLSANINWRIKSPETRAGSKPGSQYSDRRIEIEAFEPLQP